MPILETKNLEKILKTAKMNRQYLEEIQTEDKSDYKTECIENIKIQNKNFSEW